MSSSVDSAVRSTRLIHVALLVGTLLFGAIVFVLRTQGMLPAEGLAPELKILRWIGVGSVVVLVPAAFAVRSAIRSMAASRGTAARLEGVRAAAILFGALLEAGCLLNVVAWMITGATAWNGTAALVVWLTLAASMPTREQFESAGRA